MHAPSLGTCLRSLLRVANLASIMASAFVLLALAELICESIMSMRW